MIPKLWIPAVLLWSMTAGSGFAADEYPARPVRVIVPYAAGGADTYIRPLQDTLAKKHGITLVIDTVVGAGGIVGANQVKRSAPDGYTLLFCGTGALTIAPKVQAAAYTYADFSPIVNLVTIPYIIAVRTDAPFQNFGGMLDYMKRNPGKLTYGSPGSGSAPHLAMEAMAERLGVVVTHVPFAGVVPAVTAVVGGHTDAVIGAPSNVLPQVRGGKLVGLAVTSRERFAFAADLPTLMESGANVDVSTSFGFLAPKGTPRPVIDRLAAAISDAARDPAFLSAMERLQNKINVLSAEGFATLIAAESANFDAVIAKLPRQ